MKIEGVLIGLAIAGARTSIAVLGNDLIRRFKAEGHFIKCMIYVSYIITDIYTLSKFPHPLIIAAITSDLIYLGQGIFSYFDWKAKFNYGRNR